MRFEVWTLGLCMFFVSIQLSLPLSHRGKTVAGFFKRMSSHQRPTGQPVERPMERRKRWSGTQSWGLGREVRNFLLGYVMREILAASTLEGSQGMGAGPVSSSGKSASRRRRPKSAPGTAG